MPIWAISIPKKQFLEAYKKEKGRYPAGENWEEAIKKYGNNLPVSNNKRSSLLEKWVVATEEEFIKQNQPHDPVGVHVIGQVYSPKDKRELSLEFMQPTECSLMVDFKHFPYVFAGRWLGAAEAGGTLWPSKNIPLHAQTIMDYFSGKFAGKDLDEVQYSNGKYATDLVDMYRSMNMSEEPLFKEHQVRVE